VYLYTSNPHAASGDGIAMAWRAGCPVMNLEFIQFHPTCLFHQQGSNMLLSEALRGEGAHLIDRQGHRFVLDYDERGEMAPRDIVARAIDHEMKKQGVDCMYLDARSLGKETIIEHFPNIHDRLQDFGLDMTREPIPVVPAAHYICGGIQTDLHGHTQINGLYAIGETACTGLHGANRLASNSLLECLVMADYCAADILKQPTLSPPSVPDWDDSGIIPETERIQIKQNWDEIRATMSNFVGIVRSDERLRRARRRLRLISEEIASYYWKHPVSQDLLELRNLALVAELIIQSAQQRHESRGLHYSTDHPETDCKPVDTILTPETHA
jgi:L-aspartate oxidase